MKYGLTQVLLYQQDYASGWIGWVARCVPFLRDHSHMMAPRGLR